MKRVFALVAVFLFPPATFIVPAYAQQKPAAPVASTTTPAIPAAPAPNPAPSAPIAASEASQNKILKAEHALDQLKNDEADIAQQFMTLQRQGDQLNSRFKADKDKEPPLEKAVNEANEEAWKASGLSKDKYNFDPANFTFVPKPEEKPKAQEAVMKLAAPPAPAKK